MLTRIFYENKIYSIFVEKSYYTGNLQSFPH